MIGYGSLTFIDYKILMSGVGTATFGLTQYASLTCSGVGSFAATSSTNYGYATLPALSGFGGDISSYGAGDATFPALESYAEGGLYVPTVTNYGYATMSKLVSAGILGTISYMNGYGTLPAMISKGGEGEYGEGSADLPALVSLGVYDATPGERKLYNACFVLTGLSPRPDYIVFLNASGQIVDTISGNQAYIAELLASLEASDSYTVIGSFLASLEVSLSTLGDIVAASGTAPALDDTSRVWVVNIDTAATSQYDDYGFNSFLGDTGDGKCYGLADDGIYELTGNTDTGAAIPWQVDFGISNCGIKARKKILNVYVGVTTGGTTYLKVNVDGVDHTYRVEPCVRGPYDYRTKIPHDIQGHQWGFTLMSSDDTDLIGVEFAPANLTRRI